jgi:hypothetical protein
MLPASTTFGVTLHPPARRTTTIAPAGLRSGVAPPVDMPTQNRQLASPAYVRTAARILILSVNDTDPASVLLQSGLHANQSQLGPRDLQKIT